MAPFSAWINEPWAGKVLTMEIMISNDIPLPIPFWVMSSPIHMSSAVPAVSVSTTTLTVPMWKSGSRLAPDWPEMELPRSLNRKAKLVDWITAMPTVR